MLSKRLPRDGAWGPCQRDEYIEIISNPWSSASSFILSSDLALKIRSCLNALSRWG